DRGDRGRRVPAAQEAGRHDGAARHAARARLSAEGRLGLMRWIRASLRRHLLVGILVPVGVVVACNAALLYRQALNAADTAYDRTLPASLRSIGESLEVAPGAAGPARLRSPVPYSALETCEADSRSRMFFRVSGFEGEMVAGFEDLPLWRGPLP